MNTRRDPRTDPRPGDVVTNGHTETWEVEGVGGGSVTYVYRSRSHCTVKDWARRRINARVVARGAERGTS